MYSLFCIKQFVSCIYFCVIFTNSIFVIEIVKYILYESGIINIIIIKILMILSNLKISSVRVFFLSKVLKRGHCGRFTE